MIIVRAPLRVSFVGGGTDTSDFYTKSTGRVLSAAINKYVYVTVTATPFQQITARYSVGETVRNLKELKNDRIREALLVNGIMSGIEISTFSDLPGQTGLGSSSSFSVALVKALSLLRGRQLDSRMCAEEACRLEIDLVKEPIGKQDQYAAAFGGMNVFEFQADGTVAVDPVHLDFRRQLDFEKHLLLFFTGITRKASSVLSEQKENISKDKKHIQTLIAMAESVVPFRQALLKGDFETLGKLLHEGWARKRSLAHSVSNDVLDELYETALREGAWGGKVLGAGGGGCLLFVVHPEKREHVARALEALAAKQALAESSLIPFSFVHSGVEVVVNTKD